MNNGEIRAFIEAYKNVKEDSKYEFSGSQILKIIEALEQPTMDKAMIHTLAKENDELKVEIGKLRQALEQNTVSEEEYTQEHFARKEAEQKLWELQQNVSDDCVSRAEVLNLVRFNAFHVKSQLKAIENMPSVTPTFPKGATNGDVIKTMFPQAIYNDSLRYVVEMSMSIRKDMEFVTMFDKDWWNAPYKRGEDNV